MTTEDLLARLWPAYEGVSAAYLRGDVADALVLWAEAEAIAATLCDRHGTCRHCGEERPSCGCDGGTVEVMP